MKYNVRKIKLVALITMTIIATNACNKQEFLVQEVPLASIKTEMKNIGEAFRFAARLKHVTSSSRTSLLSSSTDIKSGMVEYLTDVYGEEVDDAVEELEKLSVIQELSSISNNLNIYNGYSFSLSGRSLSTSEQLNENLSAIESVFNSTNMSQLFKEQISRINEEIISVTSAFTVEVEKRAEIIDGDYFVTDDSLSEIALSGNMKKRIIQIEDNIISNESLSADEKQLLLNYTTAFIMNIDNIMEYVTGLQLNDHLDNGRTTGFFRKLGKLFSNAVTAIVATSAAAVGAVIGAASGAAIGNVPGAIAGGIIGAYIGLEVVYDAAYQ